MLCICRRPCPNHPGKYAKSILSYLQRILIYVIYGKEHLHGDFFFDRGMIFLVNISCIQIILRLRRGEKNYVVFNNGLIFLVNISCIKITLG